MSTAETRNSRDELASFVRVTEIMAGLVIVSVIEGFLLQQWRELEFFVTLPNFVLLAVLCVVMATRYVRYLRTFMRESRRWDPSARWYQRLRYNPTGATSQRSTVGSLVLVGLIGLIATIIVIGHGR